MTASPELHRAAIGVKEMGILGAAGCGWSFRILRGSVAERREELLEETEEMSEKLDEWERVKQEG